MRPLARSVFDSLPIAGEDFIDWFDQETRWAKPPEFLDSVNGTMLRLWPAKWEKKDPPLRGYMLAWPVGLPMMPIPGSFFEDSPHLAIKILINRLGPDRIRVILE